MDTRSAASTLSQIGELLELTGAPRFSARAYRIAADAVRALEADDLAPLLASGELADTPGVGPATLSVLRELQQSGESHLLTRLRESVPAGLSDVARVPGVSAARAHLIHETLGVGTLDELQQAASDGRLATVKGFGPRTVQRVLRGIAMMRESSGLRRLPRAMSEAASLLGMVKRHPDVSHAEVAGEIRRRCEVAGDTVIVARCSADPHRVTREIADGASVRSVSETEHGSLLLELVDDTRLELYVATDNRYALALWHATGSAEHVREIAARAEALGLRLTSDHAVIGASGNALRIASEAAWYGRLSLDFIPPELREGMGEMEAAADHTLPQLVTERDMRGALHCHTTYSDGTTSIAELVDGAIARGWRYIGISDHSQAAFYAGGMKPDAVRRQHQEIDELNASVRDFRILKGVECDILADGRLDYDSTLLDSFDYVIGSVHSQFRMSEADMTARVLRALDDPRLTILGHPTGRLLLSREGYALDLHAVIAKAAEIGVAIELNADAARLDLDWRWCRVARGRGVKIVIGPDAHSVQGLDNVELGVMLARKGWLRVADLLNSYSADEIVTFAQKREGGAH